jgi:hypothetical protein
LRWQRADAASVLWVLPWGIIFGAEAALLTVTIRFLWGWIRYMMGW